MLADPFGTPQTIQSTTLKHVTCVRVRTEYAHETGEHTEVSFMREG